MDPWIIAYGKYSTPGNQYRITGCKPADNLDTAIRGRFAQPHVASNSALHRFDDHEIKLADPDIGLRRRSGLL
jgi:hypothetical protein